ncbi:MAG: hypothetical protein ACT4QG_19355 [Sporichthyaceae bacterium]
MSKSNWEPRGFEDLGYRVKYRLQRMAYTVFGPPQLAEHNDPLKRIARERAARYAHRRPLTPA